MEIKNILIAVVFFSMIFIGMGTFYNELATSYGVQNVTDVTAYNYMGEISNFTSDINSQIPEGGTGIFSFYYAVALVWNVLILILNMPIILISILTDIMGIGIIGGLVPWWIVTGISTIIWIVIIFAVVKFILGRGDS